MTKTRGRIPLILKSVVAISSAPPLGTQRLTLSPFRVDLRGPRLVHLKNFRVHEIYDPLTLSKPRLVFQHVTSRSKAQLRSFIGPQRGNSAEQSRQPARSLV